ncbi:MAG: sodium:proton antiporter [Microbacterium sp. SCN 70-27]|uniref:dicarboxylate/amino acid:cation symporter n=1 Tax=unclassified Microbacterium TaxID=2609290 RepID=UPI00086D45D9|nr:MULTISPECIES: dicarboxylate/amino acid:cation symporter [unclassified Microbacterium]MBN9225524.1 dicarboxylate/amino acid:cation symporter [Microbacterium sp.]ODT26839.1 MAG: sodium:proton antiporter [Microbacterium sp. SCN 70-27]
MSSTRTAVPAPNPAARTSKPKKPFYRSFGFQITIGLVAGILLGIFAVNLGPDGEGNPNGLAATLSTVGNAYVTLLKVAVVPLIFLAIVASITQLRNVTNAARLAGQTLLWFGITALIAVTIGIVLGITIQPGNRVAHDQLSTGDPYTVGTWFNFLKGLIPQNFLGLTVSTSVDASTGSAVSTVGFNVLQVIVISVAVGIAALKLGRRAEPFVAFTQSSLKIVQRVLWWIIRIAPIGTLGLIGSAVVQYGTDKLLTLIWFAVAVYIGLAVVLFVVYPILVKTHGLSIKQYFSGVWPAVQLGFVSRSSIGTLPLTQRVTERNLGVPREYASFAVPLGATTKMDGCAAIYPAIAAIFVAQFFGIELNIVSYLLIALVSVVGSAATAGTTGATVMLTLTLSTLGLPLAGVGLLLAIDPILDMGRTAVNVAGQALVPAIVAKREGILDESLYNAPRDGDPFADDSGDDADAEVVAAPADARDDGTRTEAVRA